VDDQPPDQPGPASDQGRQAKACPSALCQEGAVLLGVVAPDGRVAFIQPPTRIDAAFVERARSLGRPERRFRFSSPCVETACPQWTGAGCGVVDHVLEEITPTSFAATALPACAIRRWCRWHAQRGAAACAVCPRVIADTGGTMTYVDSIRDAESASATMAPGT